MNEPNVDLIWFFGRASVYRLFCAFPKQCRRRPRSRLRLVMSMLLSSLKVACIAQATILMLGCVGALCAHHGIFIAPVLKKLSLLLTRVLLPALALSFFRFYSPELIGDFAIVFGLAAAHIFIGMLIGSGAALVRDIKAPYAQVMVLTCAVPHPALPVAMLPAIAVNWDRVRDESNARDEGLAAIGLYLTLVLLFFPTVISAVISSMNKRENQHQQESDAASSTRRVAAVVRWIGRQLRDLEPTLPCCFGGLILGAIGPVKDVLLPGGALSWLAGAVVDTGAMSPAMSIFIIGGLVWNTRKAALQRQQKQAEQSKKPLERQRSKRTTGTIRTVDMRPPQPSKEDLLPPTQEVPTSPELPATPAPVSPDRAPKQRRRSIVALVATEIAGEKEMGSSQELEQMKKDRQNAATALWTSAFSNDANIDGPQVQAKILPGGVNLAALELAMKVPNMRDFVVVCCVSKLLIMPAACIGLNAALFHAGVVPDNPMLRLILDLYPAIPTAAALVARFAGSGYDDAARFCASCMLPMYLLSIPTIAAFLVLSSALIGGS